MWKGDGKGEECEELGSGRVIKVLYIFRWRYRFEKCWEGIINRIVWLMRDGECWIKEDRGDIYFRLSFVIFDLLWY